MLFGPLAEPGCQIHAVTNHGVFESFRGAKKPGDHYS